jgi:cytochrome c oxidase subunit 4
MMLAVLTMLAAKGRIRLPQRAIVLVAAGLYWHLVEVIWSSFIRSSISRGERMRAASPIVLVWLVLLALLATTVGASFVFAGAVGLTISLGVAFAKSGLIYWRYMHLHEEAGLARVAALGAATWPLPASCDPDSLRALSGILMLRRQALGAWIYFLVVALRSHGHSRCCRGVGCLWCRPSRHGAVSRHAEHVDDGLR